MCRHFERNKWTKTCLSLGLSRCRHWVGCPTPSTWSQPPMGESAWTPLWMRTTRWSRRRRKRRSLMTKIQTEVIILTSKMWSVLIVQAPRVYKTVLLFVCCFRTYRVTFFRVKIFFLLQKYLSSKHCFSFVFI